MSIVATPNRSAQPRARSERPLSTLARGLWRWLLVPALMLGGIGNTIVVIAHNGVTGFMDFNGGLWQAGVAILHGRNPYRAAFLAHQAAIMHAGGVAAGETAKHSFSVPLYPAFANVLVAPLGALPFEVAAVLYTIAAVAAMAAALWLLGVRDWRCGAVVAISWPFLFGAVLGAIGPFLALGVAAAWRWRGHVLGPGLSVAALVAVKIFPWTLAVWLLATRRYRAFAATVALTVVLTFGAWALIGFHGLSGYATMLSNATYIQEGRADSVATVLLVFGAGPRLAQGIALLCGLGVLGIAWRLRNGVDGDRRAFGLAIIACLVATPIVWDHYMVLLFVPIALVSTRFCWLWLVPVITPTLITLSFLVVPIVGGPVRAASPDALHYAFGWLAAQAVIGVVLCTTPERRAQLGAMTGRPWARAASA